MVLIQIFPQKCYYLSLKSLLHIKNEYHNNIEISSLKNQYITYKHLFIEYDTNNHIQVTLSLLNIIKKSHV